MSVMSVLLHNQFPRAIMNRLQFWNYSFGLPTRVHQCPAQGNSFSHTPFNVFLSFVYRSWSKESDCFATSDVLMINRLSGFKILFSFFLIQASFLAFGPNAPWFNMLIKRRDVARTGTISMSHYKGNFPT